MIKRAAITRYVAYFSGISTTAISIFLINYYLDANEFAVWGIANSLIFIFSQLGQLTYVQYVEKYFPNYNDKKKRLTLYKFIKTVFIFFPIWFFFLITLYFLNYFDKFNITNIAYLFLMITLAAVIEASVEIVSKYLLTKNQSIGLDKNEFLYSKLLRLFIFVLLLLNGFSIYHLLFTNIVLRAILFIKIINLDNNSFKDIFYNIFKTHIWEDNFTKTRYTFVAFGIKTLLMSFLNILFLYYSTFATSEEIAIASLGVLIINNLRPAVASLTSLLSPIISQNVEKSNRESELIGKALYINSYSASILIFVTCVFVNFYNNFFDIEYLVGYNPDRVILLSILASTVASFYYPKLWHVKFSNLEKQLFINLSIVFILSFLLFSLFMTRMDIFICFIVFEVLVYLVSFRLYKKEFMNFKNKFAPSFYFSIIAVLYILVDFQLQYAQFVIFVIYIIFATKDFFKTRSLISSKF